MRSRKWVRWRRMVAMGMVGASLSLTGCVIPLCQRATLQTQEHQLRGIWNALQHMQDKKILEVWVIRFLDHLLAGTPYQLKSTGSTFVVVDPTHANQLCRVSTVVQQKQLRHADFLSRLHQLYQQHQLSLRNHMYRPPREYTIRGEQSQVTGGNCQSQQYHLDLVYWKSISTRYSQPYWKEACTLGHKLKSWELCFSPKFRELYQQRMRQICQ